MAKLIMTITLRGLLTVVALLCFHLNAHAAETDSISRRCVSESGLSIYDIHLDLTLRNGEIRYRFMGQDVFYDVTIERVEDRTIFGVAVFMRYYLFFIIMVFPVIFDAFRKHEQRPP